jgi:hypothetical protein
MYRSRTQFGRDEQDYKNRVRMDRYGSWRDTGKAAVLRDHSPHIEV